MYTQAYLYQEDFQSAKSTLKKLTTMPKARQLEQSEHIWKYLRKGAVQY